MKNSYSLYEAKARFSEIVRRVREGGTVTISYRGEPVAEIRPIVPGAKGLEARSREMEASGELVPARKPFAPIKTLARRPGALKRFLKDRSRF